MYRRPKSSREMPSLTLVPGEADRWWITRNLPFFFGTTPRPEQRILGKGWDWKGPAVCLSEQHVFKYYVEYGQWQSAGFSNHGTIRANKANVEAFGEARDNVTTKLRRCVGAGSCDFIVRAGGSQQSWEGVS